MRIDELVTRHFRELGDNDRNIWRYISEHREQAAFATLDELSRDCNSSKSSILRFCQKISFSGFSEFKYALRGELALEDETPTGAELMECYASLITRSMNDFRTRDFSGVFRLIEQSKKVFLYGTGTLPRAVAQEIRRVFLTGDKLFYVVEGVDEITALANALSPDDLVFVISLHGTSDNARSFARDMRARGISFVSLTSSHESEISHLSDEAIFVEDASIALGGGRTFEVLEPYFVLVGILFLRYGEYMRGKR